MKLPPVWKVKREFRRIFIRLDERILPFFWLSDRIRQHRHDRALDRVLHETTGALPFGERVAIFVLFQPKGIAGSAFLTLDHLTGQGWAVLVVSNAPLSDADRTKLAARSAHVIERPNVGYDFGAYREGWRWLDRHQHHPTRLILMNDSTWFPLRQGDDSLARMEALGADLSGHVYKTESVVDLSRDHIESHLLMLGKRALSHPVLRSFMDGYVMSNSKAVTIQRGEKGISRAAISAGLTVKGLVGRDRMIALLSPLSDMALLDVLRSLALHNDAGRARREAWLAAAAAGRPWRDDFLAWTSGELSNSRQHLIAAAFVDPAMSLGGMAFLKKQAEPRFQLARLAVMRGIAAGRIAPLDPVVDEEVEAMIRDWKPPFDRTMDPNAPPMTVTL